MVEKEQAGVKNESNMDLSPVEEEQESNIESDDSRVVNVQVKGLYKIFRQANLEVVALKNINLDIYAGEIIIIMGPSGSGKTTLLNVIAGLERPSAGTVNLHGFDLGRMRDESIQKILQNEIGIVFQFFNLIPNLTAAGNIELPMIIAKKKLKYRKSRVEELLNLIDMGKRRHHRPFTLSGGEKQRIAIAMAFANNPTIVLADEPTGNIDTASSENVMLLFRKYIETHPDKSMIIVTHNPSLRRIADRTLIIRDGEIISQLGRLKEGNGNENGDGLDISMQIASSQNISSVNHDKAEIQEIFHPTTVFPTYESITACPHCGETNIIKKYDKESGNFTVRHSQLVTRVALFCQSCYELSFITSSVQEFHFKDLE